MNNALIGAGLIFSMFLAIVFLAGMFTLLTAAIHSWQYNRQKQQGFRPSDFKYEPKIRKEAKR